jgi:glycosyltransferase involved in cell wall biosynthesis
VQLEKKQFDVSIVIPVYNNAGSLESLIEKIRTEMFVNYPEIKYELVFVDDGSTDSSWAILSANHSRVTKTVIKLTRNFGQLGAMKAGYAHAKGECLISISADLQDPVNLISRMIRAWLNGFKLVLCERSGRDDKISIRLSSKLAYFLLSREIKVLPRGGFDVFLITHELKEHLLKLKGRFNFLQGDLISLGYKFEILPYHRESRPFGKSGYTFKKRLRNFQDAIIDSNYTIINFIMKIGGIATLLSFILVIIIIVGKFRGSTPFTGFTLIACSILFIGGIQLSLIGLLGQYAIRTYDMAREKPPYFVEKIMTITPN